MNIYVIMKKIDLGGHAIEAYSDRAKAEAVCDEMNHAATEEHAKALMRHYGYSEEEALCRADRNLYEVDEIELKD